MRIKQQFTVAFMVVTTMAVGFVARIGYDYIDFRSQFSREGIYRQGSAYARNAVPADTDQRSDVDLRPLEVFYEVLDHVRKDYVEPLPKSKESDLTRGAVRQMLDSLRDPETRFLASTEAKVAQDANEGKFHGIGAVITVKKAQLPDSIEEQLVVTDTLPGSSAREAGLQTGDVISEVDGKTVLPYDPFQRADKYIKQTRNGEITRDQLIKLLQAEDNRIKDGISFQKAEDMLTGMDGKDYTLTVVRKGSKDPLKIKVASKDITIDAVTYKMVDESIGYIRINLFVKPADKEFAEAVADLKSKGANSLIIDLRDTPGGTIEEAQSIAGYLVKDQPISVMQLPHSEKKKLKPLVIPSGSTSWNGPVAVLVNGGTNGVSEVIAGALREDSGAKLVGETTFGDSLQDSLIMLRDGSAITMITGKYTTPEGQDYFQKGLVPDVSADESKSMDKAIELLASGKGKG